MSNKFLEQSLSFASLTQHELINGAKRTNRNVRQAGFLVLRETGMPSVLIELGYITNRDEERYLNSAQGQNTLANSVLKAFTKYKTEFDKRNGYVASSENNVKANSDTESIMDSPIEYKVQFMTGSKLLNANARSFKGLTPVEYYKDGNVYKYTHGSSTNEKEILLILNKVKPKFKDAFIVEFQNGVRIK